MRTPFDSDGRKSWIAPGWHAELEENMQSSTNIDGQTEQFDVLLFDRFSNHCLANFVEPLRAANMLTGQMLYSWRFCTLDGAPVVSSSGLKITPDGDVVEKGGDMLIVMPSYGVRDLELVPISRALRSAARSYKQLAGCDTGSWLLAQAGLLKEYQATIHWDELASFSETFPDVEVLRERFVIDRNRITCSGAMAAFDLVLHLVGLSHGPLLAMDVAQLFMTRDGEQAGSAFPKLRGRLVNRAVDLMQENLEHPLSIPQLARMAGSTQKTLETRMQAALQATPQAVYGRLRLNQARRLVLETNQPVSEIAARCGYENASAMTRAFKSVFRQTPRELRKNADG